MSGYLYTIKDRQTGEVLLQGTRQECADYMGCDSSWVIDLATKDRVYTAKTKCSKYKVERQVIGEVKPGGAHKRDYICCDCGVLMKNVSTSRRRCLECSRKHNRDANRARMRRLRETGLVASPKIKKANNNWCEGCIYFRGEFEINRCCNYYLDTDKRRPCPPGEGCTVRVERKGYREKKERSTDIS